MKSFCFAVLYFLCSFHLSAQEAASSKTDSLYQKALKHFNANEHPQSIATFQTLINGEYGISQLEKTLYLSRIGFSYYNLYQDDSTVKYLEIALEEKQKFRPPEDTLINRAHAVLGYIFRYQLAEYRKAAFHYDAERKTFESNPGFASADQTYLNYYNLATTHRVLKDYDRSLNYAYKALSAVPESSKGTAGYRENCYAVIANALSEKGRFEEASRYHERKIEANISRNGPQHRSLALDYYNQGLNYYNQKRPNEALTGFRKSEKLIPKKNKGFLSNVYRGIGISYLMLGETDRFRQYLSKALPLAEGYPMREAWIYQELAIHFVSSKSYKEALQNYQLSLQSLLSGFMWKNTSQNPNLGLLKVANPHVHKLLGLKAQAFKKSYDVHGDLADLENAMETYQLLDSLTDHYRANLVLESSRLFFQQRNHAFYADAIEVLYELHKISPLPQYRNQLFVWMEKNKSSLLLENLLSAENNLGLQLPDSIIKKGQNFSAALLEIQKEINACDQNQNCTEDQISDLRRKANEQEEGFRAHKQDVSAQFPKYYNIAEEPNNLTLGGTNQLMQTGQLRLNYFSTGGHYVLISSTSEGSELHRIEITDSLRDMTTLFLEEVSGKSLLSKSTTAGFDNFQKASSYLFQKLIPSHLLKDEIKELIIIPDSDLANIPFEALTTSASAISTVDFARLPYLIKNYQVQYGYSATLWAQQRSENTTSENPNIIGFGTSLKSNPVLAKLSAVTEEINGISNLKNSTVFKDEEATKKNLTEAGSKADVIHLALHNVNDYENPLNSRLILEKSADAAGELFLYEIFNLEMAPSLVVLSGCDTGWGKWQKGEGAYHMGRGFLYHGNPVLVTSLWKARDQSTSRIMQTFYEELGQNKNSTEALRFAKINFLESADELIAHPSNWAAFVGVGQLNVAYTDNTSKNLILALLAIFLLTAVGFYVKRTAQN